MTREEFIAGYGGGASLIVRTPTGIRIGDRERVALPCACGYERCEGWAMVSIEDVDDHMRMYAPQPHCPSNPDGNGGKT